MKIIDIIEARSKPGINPKVSAYEQLLKYKNDPSIFISFTALNKAGLNPRSTYNTPNGIYTYPLAKTWKMYGVDTLKDFSRYPFANNQPYIQILKATKPEAILDVERYTQTQLKRDLKNILDLYPNDEKKINRAIENAHVRTPAGKLWAATRKVTLDSTEDSDYDSIDDDDEYVPPNFEPDGDSIYNPDSVYNKINEEAVGNASANKWSTLLRKLGYGLVIDPGHSIIHSDEPCQAVFLGTKYFKHLGVALNTRTQESKKKTKSLIPTFDIRRKINASSPEDAHKINNFVAQQMNPQEVAQYAKWVLGRRWPEAEPKIMQDPTAAIEYMGKFNKKATGYPQYERWEQAEPYIMKNLYASVQYMMMTGVKLNVEQAIQKETDPSNIVQYAMVTGERLEQGELRMIQLISRMKLKEQHIHLYELIRYAEAFKLFDWPEMRKLCANYLNHGDGYDLAKHVMQFTIASGKRWPEVEHAMRKYTLNSQWQNYVNAFPDAIHAYQPTNTQ